MRKHADLEPRLMALSEADRSAARTSPSWIPPTVATVAVSASLWSKRSMPLSYWQMPGVRQRRRNVH